MINLEVLAQEAAKADWTRIPMSFNKPSW